MKFCIENIDPGVHKQHLASILKEFGNVLSFEFEVSPVNGPSRAWVEMDDKEANEVLKHLAGDVLGENPVQITQLHDTWPT